MISNLSSTLGAVVLASTMALAQSCPINVYPIRLVDAQGNLRPIAPDGSAHYDGESVYMAFDPFTPSGTYYVHVTDGPGGLLDEVLSTNDPMDRFVSVVNNNGVIALSLPFTSNPNPAVFGVGLNGAGQSLLVSPMRNGVDAPCYFKVQTGDTWDLQFGPDWPYIVRYGFNTTTNQCSVFSYADFRIGDGSGSDVSGLAFLDADRDGVRDAGETPLANWQVRLVTGQTSVTATTDANGHYVFVDAGAGDYTVELVLQPGYIATNAGSQMLTVTGCANATAADFGVAPQMLACDGHTIGYWRNCHGSAKVQQYGILATLPALHLRNTCGQQVAPSTIMGWRVWLHFANSVNMAYMLSAQLAAMHCNVVCGFVDPACVINDPCLGQMSIATLMQQAVVSLSLHGFTPVGHPQRAFQKRLKNALDDANNNRNWF